MAGMAMRLVLDIEARRLECDHQQFAQLLLDSHLEFPRDRHVMTYHCSLRASSVRVLEALDARRPRRLRNSSDNLVRPGQLRSYSNE